ncbi:MAG: GTPase Era [Candidatus Omnitrophica bacterium]|nr:GTPase Era [Candidatus Omnitrophota bacterium]
MSVVRKSGFVGIFGRPNVGKSTLLNALVGEKLSGISAKPQTTRGVIRGILSMPEGQVVYLDTPGIHKPQDSLGHWMMGEIDKAIEGLDLIYMMVLPGKTHAIEEQILEKIKAAGIPALLVVGQVDRYPKEDILPVLEHYSAAGVFADYIPVSAKKGIQIDTLIQRTFELLPEGEPHFPEDIISDQQERTFVIEIIREKIFRKMMEEVPYSTTVVIDEFKERRPGLIDIQATIVVEKESQKKIMIGSGGANLKEIGQEARMEIEQLVGSKVFLQLWVKVIQDWKKDSGDLKRLGYE